MKKCPVCQSNVPGAFCPACGAPMEGARCRSCEAPLLPGANFCTRCGDSVRAAVSNLPWYIAGAALVGLILVILFPTLRPGSGGPSGIGAGAAFAPVTGLAGAAGGAPMGSPPPLTGTPREQADRLFNRVMQAQSQGDTAQVTFFVPMAIQAYRQAGELDADGLYHLSVLETASGDAAAGRATAERILVQAPDHLLGLAAAAQAASAVGDDQAVRRYYERLVAVFDVEQGKAAPEYLDHARILPEYRQRAEAFLGR